MYHRPDSEWEYIGEIKQKEGRKANSWRKIGMEGEPNVIIQLKMVNQFPGVSADKLWELATNIEERAKWDKDRWVVCK